MERTWGTPSNVLIVNGSKQFGSSQGELNITLVNTAAKVFRNKGCAVMISNLEETYDTDEEVKKFLWADVVIYQMPVWWMGPPWYMKKYLDEVFHAGMAQFQNESLEYGLGGLLTKKSYMLSMTWAAPAEIFTSYTSFFRGATPDSILFGFHKANEYMGMKPLPSFVLFDVEKRPKVAHELSRYRRHLEILFDERIGRINMHVGTSLHPSTSQQLVQL